MFPINTGTYWLYLGLLHHLLDSLILIQRLREVEHAAFIPRQMHSLLLKPLVFHVIFVIVHVFIRYLRRINKEVTYVLPFELIGFLSQLLVLSFGVIERSWIDVRLSEAF